MPLKPPPKHFLDIDALDSKTLRAILDLAAEIKRKGRVPKSLKLKPGAKGTVVLKLKSKRPRGLRLTVAGYTGVVITLR